MQANKVASELTILLTGPALARFGADRPEDHRDVVTAAKVVQYFLAGVALTGDSLVAMLTRGDKLKMSHLQ